MRAISVCAGQGTDLLGVLADHPRAGDVRGRLVELDPRNTAAIAAPPGIEVVTGDAVARSTPTRALSPPTSYSSAASSAASGTTTSATRSGSSRS